MKRFFAVIVILLGGTAAMAGDDTVFQLKDHSRVVGKLSGYREGVFTVETQFLGTVQVKQENLAAIFFDPALAADPTANVTTTAPAAPAAKRDRPLGLDQQVQAVFGYADVMRALTEDGDIASSINDLRQDSDIQAVLDDPEIMKAIENSDFASLMMNPKIRQLMNNPKIREITGKVEAKTGRKDDAE